MKGIVFSEFVDLVEKLYSLDMVDDIIDDCDLESGGAYTSVGLYDYTEMVQLVTALSNRTNTSVTDLLHVFGKHLMEKFYQGFPEMFSGCTNLFDFLDRIDNHVHVEVRKLYPEAELPVLRAVRESDTAMTIQYESNRPFAELAYGLMSGAIDHYEENVIIERQDENSDGTKQTFRLTRRTA